MRLHAGRISSATCKSRRTHHPSLLRKLPSSRQCGGHRWPWTMWGLRCLRVAHEMKEPSSFAAAKARSSAATTCSTLLVFFCCCEGVAVPDTAADNPGQMVFDCIRIATIICGSPSDDRAVVPTCCVSGSLTHEIHTVFQLCRDVSCSHLQTLRLSRSRRSCLGDDATVGESRL